MQTVWQDLRYGFRIFLRSRGTTVLTILCLVLGTGANLTIFGLVNAVLLRPLPGVKSQDRLVLIGQTEDGQGFDSLSYPNYRDIRAQNNVFIDVAASLSTPVSLSGEGFADRLKGDIVSGNYFNLLGVTTTHGRTFLSSEDETPGAHPVVILSHSLWERRFGANPAIIGSSIKINAHDFVVIGVIEKEFRGIRTGEKVDVWLPIAMHAQVMHSSADPLNGRSDNWFNLVARLKPSISLEVAQAEMDVIAAQLRQAYPRENQAKGIKIGAHIGQNPNDRVEAAAFLSLVMAVSGLVLLIACANVANLLLARASGRRNEIAIRLALGASRWRIVTQLLTESLILSVAGSTVGLLVAVWTKDLLVNLFAKVLTPEELKFGIDVRMISFAILLSCGTALLAGLAPAIQASRPDMIPELKEGVGVSGYGKARLSNFFVIAQVALSIILLVGAGLFVRTLQKGYAINPGFEKKNLMMMSFDLELQGYNESRGREFYRQLRERVMVLPGVQHVSFAVSLSLSSTSHTRTILMPGQPIDPNVTPPQADLNIIAPGYFQTMGIPLVAGRDFEVHDDSKSAVVAVINETMARRFWPRESALGKHFEVGENSERRLVEVIGITRDSKHRTLNETPHPMIYLTFQQLYASNMFLHVRTANEPSSIVALVENEIHRLDRNLPISEVKTMDRHLDDSLWPQRAMAALIGILGLLALSLAAAGLYGVVSHAVVQRTREIGIRIALGAHSTDVIYMILVRGMGLVLTGLAVGLAAAWALTRLIKSAIFTAEAADPFFGVSMTDLMAFALSPLVLVAIALLACYVPAHRAAKVDPIVVLRYE